MNKADNEILEKAADALKAETGRELQLGEPGDRQVDVVVTLNGVEYNAEVKKWVQQANFGALVHQVQALPGRGLLVADYVNRKMAVRLKDAGVHFVDTAGNAFVDQDNLYLNIRGNDPVVALTVKPQKRAPVTVTLGKNRAIRPDQRQGTGRAFTPTGLKVVYELILNPDLISEPYRDIAAKADVALGTIGWVVNDLKAQGVVVDRGKEKVFTERKALIEAWAEAYPLKLRPKHLVGRFVAEDHGWWKGFTIEKHEAQWGGEVAAARLTKYLKPAIATIYTRGDIGRLVQDARLAKAHREEDANVELLKPFWMKDGPGDTVHPLLIYADLIATGDTRNLETARMIYDEYLDRHL